MDRSRLLIVSQRDRADGFGRQPGYIAFTEAEDVLAACTGADLILLSESLGQVGVRARRMAGRAARRAMRTNRSLPTSPLPHRAPRALRPPGEHYDVALFIGYTVWDLPLLEAVRNLRRIADKVIVWFPEVWLSELEDHRLHHEPFGLTDAIFVGMKQASHRLDDIAAPTVHHVPPAADTTRFAPVSVSEQRPVDVLGIGRRDAGLHRALLDWSRKSNKLYVYDTITGTQVPDIGAHRQNLGDTYRRSNIAITNYAKYGLKDVTGDERETPGRIWEGLASGSLMVGFPPDEELQRELIGECVVTNLPHNPPAAVDLIHELNLGGHETQRHRQVQLALRNHDWVHRWIKIFELSNLPVPEGLTLRRQQLESMADQLEAAHSAR